MASITNNVDIHIRDLRHNDVQVECYNSSTGPYITIRLAYNYIFIHDYESAATLFRQLVPGAILSLAVWLSKIKDAKEEVTNAETVSNS